MSFDPGAVEAAMTRTGIRWSLHHVPACPTTQDLALEALRDGAGEGWVVSTDFQEHGRGRHATTWVAPAGGALLFSLLLEPRADVLPVAPLLAGVCVVDGIAALTGLRCDLKWPNDVLAHGRKLAGILVEHPPGPLIVVGIGINVNMDPADLPAGAVATSLSIGLGRRVAREGVLGAVLDAFGEAYAHVGGGGGAAWVIDAWRQRSKMLGRRVVFETAGRRRTGVAEDLMEDGALLVRLADGGVERLHAGEVRRLRRQS
jgi:BirA family transcriptional regulator, biotin operon repressor / biotin---[acetyl-CoA-carboxylase] ligase